MCHLVCFDIYLTHKMLQLVFSVGVAYIYIKFKYTCCQVHLIISKIYMILLIKS